MADPLNDTIIRAALTTAWLGRPCHYYENISSTNETLKNLVATGNNEYPSAGTLVVADYQSQGKGRLNRRWEAPAGSSLLFSMLFRPYWRAEQATWLAMIAGLATAEGIAATTGLAVGLKWPNDLVVEVAATVQGVETESKAPRPGDAPTYRKLGGILLETDFANDRLSSAILGIGINVNIFASQLPAGTTPTTSLLIETGRPVSRLALLVAILSQIEAHYEAAEQGQSPQPAWSARLVTLGKQVFITGRPLGVLGGADQQFEGVAEGTDAWGHLIVRDNAGLLRIVAAGDATLRK